MNGKTKHTDGRWRDGGDESADTTRGHAAPGGARRYLQCWCCRCCKYFAGYQHGLVSKPCVWLHPESRGRERGKERKQKGKENK